jgi:hypothetical protein
VDGDREAETMLHAKRRGKRGLVHPVRLVDKLENENFPSVLS